MLVLSRKPGERILIGDDIVVTVVRFNGGTVRLGIEAPREFPVIREELSQAMAESQGSPNNDFVVDVSTEAAPAASAEKSTGEKSGGEKGRTKKK